MSGRGRGRRRMRRGWRCCPPVRDAALAGGRGDRRPVPGEDARAGARLDTPDADVVLDADRDPREHSPWIPGEPLRLLPGKLRRDGSEIMVFLIEPCQLRKDLLGVLDNIDLPGVDLFDEFGDHGRLILLWKRDIMSGDSSAVLPWLRQSRQEVVSRQSLVFMRNR